MARNIIKIARGTSAKLTGTPIPAALQAFEPVFMTDGAKSFGIVTESGGTKSIEWIGIDASKLTKGYLDSDRLGDVPASKISGLGSTAGLVLVTTSAGGINTKNSGEITVGTALNAEKLGGNAPTFYRNASNINTGILNSDRIGDVPHDKISVAGATNGNILIVDGNGKVNDTSPGNITVGTALDAENLGGNAPTFYRNASNINTGTLNIARIPTGTTGSTVALGNHNHAGVYAAISHSHARLENSYLAGGQSRQISFVLGEETGFSLSATDGGTEFYIPFILQSSAEAGKALVFTGTKGRVTTIDLATITIDGGAIT